MASPLTTRHADWYCARCGHFIAATSTCFDCGLAQGLARPEETAARVTAPRPMLESSRLSLHLPRITSAGPAGAWLTAACEELAEGFLAAFTTTMATGRVLDAGSLSHHLSALTPVLTQARPAELVRMLEATPTRSHAAGTLLGSLLLATSLDLRPGMLEAIALASLVHDVGSGGMPDDGEVCIHPLQGAQLLERHANLLPWLDETILTTVRHHHDDLRHAREPRLFMTKLVAVTDRLDQLLRAPAPAGAPRLPAIACRLAANLSLDSGLVHPLLARLGLAS